MSNKFLCGRVLMQKDGSAKKLSLAEGGGARDCFISHIDMGFDEIHDRLREIFGFSQENYQTKLYDFRCKELDTDRYETFYDYIQKHGLRFKSILLYLCTPPDGETALTNRSPDKRKTMQVNPTPRPVVRIPQVEADSSTPLPVVKPDIDIIAVNESAVNPRPSDRVRRSSFSSYSFEASLNELITYLRDLIPRSNHENILIQLFENICTLRGLSSIILDRSKRQTSDINGPDNSIYHDGLDKIDKICRTINALIELNRMNISHLDSHSLIIQSFNDFQQNFHILRQNRHTNISRSSTNQPVDPPPTPSSSTRRHSEKNSHKRPRNSSPDPYLSARQREADEDNKKYGLFKNFIRALEHLLHELSNRRLISFINFIENLIVEVKTRRSELKVFDNNSLHALREALLDVENRLATRMNDEHRHVAPRKLNAQLQRIFDKTLDTLRNLLRALSRCAAYNDLPKRLKTSPVEEKPETSRSKTRSNDEEESSETSHSSVGDEVLMELARVAYDRRPNRSKKN